MQTVDGKLADEALRDSEARADAILATAVDAVVVIDERGTVETFNPAAERIFGYAAAEVVGRNVKVLMPEPYRHEHDGYLENYLRTGQKRIIGIGREVVGRRKDGTVFPVELAVSEARLRDRRAFVGVVRDVSERKQAEESLRESNRRLERALADLQAKGDEVRAMSQQLWQAAKLAAVGELAASIAHELNNPLATVSLRVETLLGQTAADDPRRRPLEVVEQEVDRMADLVANLLQFSRRGQPRASTVDVADDLAKTLDLIQHHLRTRSIRVVQDLAPDVPVIQADRQQLRQVFLNLLTNASDAMPEGGTVTVRAGPGRLEDGRPGVVIEFADTGAGIRPEHLPKVMEPFFTTKEEGKGTGLGLAICRRAVQEHGGAISVASEVGKGTVVRVVLPLGSGTTVGHCGDS
ncbi:MAG: PAS domain S-box protein [Gemmataceae bacterium]|nr:PAS domain S-box protein [Gemmataceae bacterium]